MTTTETAFSQFQGFLREMFQFDDNELDFGLFKVLRLKRTFIEQFIDGDGEQDLKRIVQRELAAIRGADEADERQWLANRCDLLGLKTKNAWAEVLADPQDPQRHAKLLTAVRGAEEEATLENTLERLTRWLDSQKLSSSYPPST